MHFHRTVNTGVFALATAALALLVSLLVRPLLEPSFFLPFVGAVLASSRFHGRMGGFLATVLSAAAVVYFFMPLPLGANDLVRLTSFTALAVIVTWLAASLGESRRILRATLASIGDGVIATDANLRVTYANPAAAELTGWSAAEARGKEVEEVFRLVRDEESEAVDSPMRRAFTENSAVAQTEHLTLVSRSGTRIAVESTASPVRDEKGVLRGGVLVFRDVSTRRNLEEQLSQAQKMEAVGRLAGNVAGDFNNVLTVITGYSELLRLELASSHPLRRFADEIMWAAERAAGLTRQLLAFSRGPGAQPKLLDLNGVLGNMEPMLRRLVGENVELIVLPGPGLGRVHADPGQIEQVITHLAANARDAMPQGGKLVIETANVDLQDPASSRKVGLKPGEYVMLAVSDTGVGMDANTRARLFEPFFTAKEPGKGSGLGLSTVYGIVRQSGGQITVYSQPGCGTIFEIYLPRVTEAPPPARKAVKRKGSETILLVDDEEGVRKLVFAVLQSNGYSVIEAAGGGAALSAFEKNSHKIDLVLTDVVMPQMSGYELGEELAEQRAGLKILYMSGYRDSAIGEPVNQGKRPFLHKPFTPDTLLEKVREVLDTRTGPAQ